MSQELFTKLSNRLSNRFSIDSSGMTTTDWVMANTTLRGKPFNIEGYEFQRAILDDNHTNMCCVKCSQVGLALALDTPIPTVTGWTTMGEITVGEEVYDENGKVCKVTYVSPVYAGHTCYELEFDDHSKIVADAQHRWKVNSVERVSKFSGGLEAETEILNTETISKRWKYRATRNLFSINNTKPLDGVITSLLVDPYYLGLWLGDGHSASTRLTGQNRDIEELEDILSKRGLVCKRVSEENRVINLKVELLKESRGKTLQQALTKLGVRSKHIPQNYLRASEGVRWELLQGLMDTDGTISKRGRCSFYNTNIRLVEGFQELIHSLGFKSRIRWKKPRASVTAGGYVIQSKKPLAEVSFTGYSDQSIFKLSRKQSRLKAREKSKPTKVTKRRIINVIEVPSVLTRCISVDSESHLFLAGKAMIPTHNTELQIRSTLSLLIRRNGTSAIFSLPTEDMYERVSKARIKPIVDHDSVFNTSKDRSNKAVRTAGMMQFGNSYLYVVAATESAATSVPADAVINDELDLSDQKMIALFNSRMQNSSLKLSRKFSTPTFPKHGIDLHWQHSDQHHYLVRCEGCNHWQHPEFTRDFIQLPGLSDNIEDLSQIDGFIASTIDLRTAYVKCEKCHRPLNLMDPSLREWVPFYPSRVNSRGFRVSPFCTAKLDVQYIIQQLLDYQKSEYVRGWWNTVLGLPYSDSSIQIPVGAIRACMKTASSEPPASGDPVFVGIDMGKTCHIVLGRGVDGRHIFHFETVPVESLLDRVEEILKEYNVVAGGIDRYPYTPTSNEVYELSGRKIVPIAYEGNAEVTLVKDPYGEITHAQVNRTTCLDNVMTSIKKQQLIMTGYGEKKQVVEDHLRDMVRDAAPDQKVKWVKLSNNDHFFHAIGYVLVSPKVVDLIRYKDDSDLREMSMIQELSVGVNDTPDPRSRGLFNNYMDTSGIIGYR